MKAFARMRDLMLFTCCCLLGLAFWVSARQRTEVQQSERQQELYQIGSPQGMTPSPERSLLMGDFTQGLRSNPGPETYAKLADLFLVSADLEKGRVVAHAFTEEFMARVVGTQLELFDAQGRALSAKLWSLDKEVKPLAGPFVAATKSVSLVAEGSWIVYRDSGRWLTCRRQDDLVRGFLSTREVTVEGDLLTLGKDRSWTWTKQGLEVVADPSLVP